MVMHGMVMQLWPGRIWDIARIIFYSWQRSVHYHSTGAACPTGGDGVFHWWWQAAMKRRTRLSPLIPREWYTSRLQAPSLACDSNDTIQKTPGKEAVWANV